MIFVTVGTHEQPFNRLVKKIDELKRDGVITEEVIIQTGFSTYEPKYCKWSREDYYWQFKQVLLEMKKNNLLLEIDNFEDLYSEKLWEIVARAITQSRYKLDFNKNENIQYLKKIRNDSEVQKYISNFYKIRKNLKRQYIFLLTLFIKKQYTLLWFFLYLRNKV